MPRKRQRTPVEARAEKRRQRAARRGVTLTLREQYRPGDHPSDCTCYDCLFPPIPDRLTDQPRLRKDHYGWI